MYFKNEEVEERVLEYQRTRDVKIIEELEPIFKNLINGVISRYKLLRRNYINDDLAQEAWVGIMEAIHKWDKTKGDAFSFFTVISKNKIFWYLKNQYKDTSITSDEPITVNVDDNNANFDIYIGSHPENVEHTYAVLEFITKIKISDLKVRSTDENKRILEHIKNKVICNEGKSIDNIVYADLIREIQKETKIPKKNIKYILEKIYKTYTGGKVK